MKLFKAHSLTRDFANTYVYLKFIKPQRETLNSNKKPQSKLTKFLQLSRHLIKHLSRFHSAVLQLTEFIQYVPRYCTNSLAMSSSANVLLVFVWSPRRSPFVFILWEGSVLYFENTPQAGETVVNKIPNNLFTTK